MAASPRYLPGGQASLKTNAALNTNESCPGDDGGGQGDGYLLQGLGQPEDVEQGEEGASKNQGETTLVRG
jgi:hypothetical protein